MRGFSHRFPPTVPNYSCLGRLLSLCTSVSRCLNCPALLSLHNFCPLPLELPKEDLMFFDLIWFYWVIYTSVIQPFSSVTTVLDVSCSITHRFIRIYKTFTTFYSTLFFGIHVCNFGGIVCLYYIKVLIDKSCPSAAILVMQWEAQVD